MTANVFKVGIVGTGVGVRTHFAGFAQFEDVSIVGVVGSSPESARARLAAAGYPPQLACDFTELLKSAPDLICVTTPSNARQDYLDQLRDYAGGLLLEKPIALSGPAAQDVADALPAARGNSYVNFQLRGLPALSFVRDVARSGELGRIYDIALLERNSIFRADRVPKWMEHRSTGGGQTYGLGAHLIDLGVFLAGGEYSDVEVPKNAAVLSSPRLSWASELNDRSDLSEETFDAKFDVGQTKVRLFTTAISAGVRTLEFIVKASHGTVEFRYRDGRGELCLSYDNGGRRTFTLGPNGELVDAEKFAQAELNPSLFRVAFLPYARAAIDDIQGRSNPMSSMVARLEDGIANARVIDDLLASNTQM